ncbi:MAG: pilus assembly protein PilM [Candidatus Paceibacterota bacterium]
MSSLVTERSTLLERAFPMPHFLILSDVALDLSDGVLRFFELRRSRGRATVKRFGARPFPRVHIDAANEKSRAESAAALGALSTEFGFRNVRVLVHEDEAYVFRLTVPSTDESTFREAIESVLEENVPIPPAEAVFEYEVARRDEEKGETVLGVSVLPESVLGLYAELVRSGGLFPVSFETESRSLARSLIPHGDQRARAILDIKADHSVMCVVEAGAVVFSSSIGVGTSDMVNAIAKSFGISIDAAKKMRAEQGFSQNKEDTKMFDAMMPVLSTLHDEVGKMLVYWSTQAKKNHGTEAVEDIIISGESAALAGVAKYISITSRIPVRIASVWDKVLDPRDSLPDLSRRESLDYAALIGILLS